MHRPPSLLSSSSSNVVDTAATRTTTAATVCGGAAAALHRRLHHCLQSSPLSRVSLLNTLSLISSVLSLVDTVAAPPPEYGGGDCWSLFNRRLTGAGGEPVVGQNIEKKMGAT
ncbi:hypothetical protein Hanom_Chr12g01138171 [Helianthus anomalus]